MQETPRDLNRHFTPVEREMIDSVVTEDKSLKLTFDEINPNKIIIEGYGRRYAFQIIPEQDEPRQIEVKIEYEGDFNPKKMYSFSAPELNEIIKVLKLDKDDERS